MSESDPEPIDEREWAEMLARQEREEAEKVARAAEIAHAAGKEPFDWDRLQRIHDIMGPAGYRDSVDLEELRKKFEYKYYCIWKDIRTLQAFADKMEEMEGWG